MSTKIRRFGTATSWAGTAGFEDNGDAYLSGFKRKLTDSTSLIYTNALGRFNDDPASTPLANAARFTARFSIPN